MLLGGGGRSEGQWAQERVSHTGAAGTSRLVGIEGLRAVAAVSILVYHVWLYASPNATHAPLGPLNKVMPHLTAGVTLFFVLSGFLLFRPYVASALRGAGSPRIRQYFVNRALRILPAYWAILFLVALLFEHQLLRRPAALLANAVFLQFSIPHLLPSNLGSSNGMIGIVPSWSLAIEVVFYLCIPILGGAAIRIARGRLPAAWAALMPVGFMLGVGLAAKVAEHRMRTLAHPWWEFSFPVHADWFAAGMAVAVLRVLWEDGRFRMPRFAASLALASAMLLVLVAIGLRNDGVLSDVEYQTPIAFGCALLLAVVVLPRGNGILLRVLTLRPFVTVGLASYSLFLIHDPVVRGLRDAGVTRPGTSGFLYNLAIVAGLAGAASAISYRWVEKPALSLKSAWQGADSAADASVDAFGTIGKGELEGVRPRLSIRGRNAQEELDLLIAAAAGHRAGEVTLIASANPAPHLAPEALEVGWHLLRNALAYGASPVQLTLRHERDRVQLTVEDRGRGVSADFVPRLFEPSTRSDASEKDSDGRGLGLFVARTLAGKLGGAIEFTPAEPTGARFDVSLPSRSASGRGRFKDLLRRIGSRFQWSGVGDWLHRPVRRMVRFVPQFAVLGGIAVLLLPAAAAAASPSPSTMAALGDSLTQAYQAGGAPGDDPAESWATGTDSSVNSHYLRLLAQNAAISGHGYNDAVSGSKISATSSQATAAIGQNADYVTIWAGTNDVCTSTISQMTSVSSFTGSLQTTLSQLTAALPSARILVLSIPDWYGLWQAFQANVSAQSAWSTFNNRCPDIFGAGATTSDRQTVSQRITDLNTAISTTCGQFATCATDSGAAFSLWATLSSSDLATDYFHLSPSGQAKVAAATWGQTPWGGGGGGGSGGGGGGSGGGGSAPAPPVLPDVTVTSSSSTTGDLHVGDTLTASFDVSNKAGHADGTNLHLLIALPDNVKQVGSAYYEHGSGCTGTAEVDCFLDYLSGGRATPVRIRVKVTTGTAIVITARLTESELDANANDNATTLEIPVAGTATTRSRLTIRAIHGRIVRGKRATLRLQIDLSAAATVTASYRLNARSRPLATWIRHPRAGKTTLVLTLPARRKVPRVALLSLVATHGQQRTTASATIR